MSLDIPISAPAIQLGVSGHIFFDENGNGVWDGQEPVLRNWHVVLSQELVTGAPRSLSQTPGKTAGYYAFVPEVMARQRFLPGTYVNERMGIPSARPFMNCVLAAIGNTMRSLRAFACGKQILRQAGCCHIAIHALSCPHSSIAHHCAPTEPFLP